MIACFSNDDPELVFPGVTSGIDEVNQKVTDIWDVITNVEDAVNTLTRSKKNSRTGENRILYNNRFIT